jgi:hypothetical protein
MVMSSPEGAKIAETVRLKVKELSELCASVDEVTASRAPADRWTPKEVLSHLLGGEEGGISKAVEIFLKEETPRIDLDPGNPFYTDKRSRMTFAELLAALREEYGRLIDVAAALSAEQLTRKAHIPALKESPLGEYPSLAAFLEGLVVYHVGFHVDHMREILQGLGKA